MMTINQIRLKIPSRRAGTQGNPISRQTLWRWVKDGVFPPPDRYIMDSPVWLNKSVRLAISRLVELGRVK